MQCQNPEHDPNEQCLRRGQADISLDRGPLLARVSSDRELIPSRLLGS